MIQLESLNCVECGKTTRVPMILPYEGKEEPTGMTIHRMDDDYQEHYMGVICRDCADTLLNNGVIGIGYAGFPHSEEAMLSKPYRFKHSENIQECHCSTCDDERYEEEEEEWC